MLEEKWSILSSVWKSEGFEKFMDIVRKEYKTKTIYPPYESIFNAFKLTSYDDVKVVILGQDPYHGVNEAHGLAFSVKEGVKIPPSLQNIFKELKSDLGIEPPTSGDLTKWATQGVLLLNSVLTVEKDKAASHSNIGWQLFTDHVIKLLNMKSSPVVFVLWGSYARSKKVFITNKHHLIIESVHPSPLSAHNGFFGSKPFSKINAFLKSNNMSEIDFRL